MKEEKNNACECPAGKLHPTVCKVVKMVLRVATLAATVCAVKELRKLNETMESHHRRHLI